MPCFSTRCPGRPPYVLFPLTASLPVMGSRSSCANSTSSSTTSSFSSSFTYLPRPTQSSNRCTARSRCSTFAFQSCALCSTFSRLRLAHTARSLCLALPKSASFSSHCLTFPSALDLAARSAPNELESLRSSAYMSSRSTGDSLPLPSTTSSTSSGFNAAAVLLAVLG